MDLNDQVRLPPISEKRAENYQSTGVCQKEKRTDLRINFFPPPRSVNRAHLKNVG